MGAPRSGTTLTANILNRHPEIFAAGENLFFEDIFTRRAELGDLSDPASQIAVIDRLLSLYGRYNQPDDQTRVDAMIAHSDFAEGLKRNATSYRALLSYFMQRQAQHAGKAQWANSTPKDIFHASAILDFYPDAKLVICIRDPRDFLASYKHRWQVSAHGDRLRALYHPVVTAALWRSSANQIQHVLISAPAENIAIVRYENLTHEPEKTVRELCASLNTDYHDDLLDVTTHNSSQNNADRRGIFTSSVDAWDRLLSPEETSVTQAINAETMRHFGYTPTSARARPLRLMALWLSAPFSACRAIWANRKHRGPLAGYVIRRTASLFKRAA